MCLPPDLTILLVSPTLVGGTIPQVHRVVHYNIFSSGEKKKEIILVSQQGSGEIGCGKAISQEIRSKSVNTDLEVSKI